MSTSSNAGTSGAGPSGSAKVTWYYDPKVRGVIYQVITLGAVVALAAIIIHNTAVNLASRNIAQGYGFLTTSAGFDLAMTPIDFPRDATYGRAIMVGLVNTLLVAAIGIIFASLFGFLAGVGRLSQNYLISRVSTIYVEVCRNVPLLLQIFFWYFAVLQVLPNPRNSVEPIPGWIFLNNRGLFLPEVKLTEATGWAILGGLVVGVIGAIAVSRWARQRQIATGAQFPAGKVGLALILGLPILGLVVTGLGLTLVAPVKGGFNVAGGTRVIPEFAALVVALSVYTGTYIAEIVRAGILAVSWGQTEAARSLGLPNGPTLRLIIIPQAMRVIIPPLTNQYLNLTKNSSLAVAIGFPDLVYVGGTVLNQTGQAIEIIAIWMAIYLGLSVATSVFMNWYNARVAIVER
ncbi:amino acid ABC transporter permease [Methyloraptor flagellatus]|jgi:general L-amino acid transport system permease protein|uniref:Amino acid ABC transporter permease n=1 Tax=Methyloraptor flagellatus TaxID=3162530 RepID=A0AAU7XGB1_9HYPH